VSCVELLSFLRCSAQVLYLHRLCLAAFYTRLSDAKLAHLAALQALKSLRSENVFNDGVAVASHSVAARFLRLVLIVSYLFSCFVQASYSFYFHRCLIALDCLALYTRKKDNAKEVKHVKRVVHKEACWKKGLRYMGMQ
jgi:predicted membrane protein